MKLHKIPTRCTPNTRKSALTALFMTQVFDCDHSMEKYNCVVNPCIFIYKPKVSLYNKGNIYCQVVCLVSSIEYLYSIHNMKLIYIITY
jgi:hypothetical protein